MTTAPLSDAQYTQLTQAVLARVEQQADAWLQDDVIDIDTLRQGGLLELRLPAGRVLVINTQPPLQELWLASPAGGYHFAWDGSAWIEGREGGEFYEVLSRELSRFGGSELRVTA